MLFNNYRCRSASTGVVQLVQVLFNNYRCRSASTGVVQQLQVLFNNYMYLQALPVLGVVNIVNSLTRNLVLQFFSSVVHLVNSLACVVT